MNFRNLIGQLVSRSRLANVAGYTFNGRRNLYKALGYQRQLFIQDYRARFDRNSVANRIVKALPNSTWRGGAELIEDEDPTTETVFEKAFDDLNDRLKIWSTLKKVDILAGIGRYAVLLIGAPGDMQTPLISCRADEIVYLRAYSEEDAQVFKWDLDSASPRYGLPVLYNLTRLNPALVGMSENTRTLNKQVHYTRVLHVSDGLLDDDVFGEPRLRCVWNDLDDLEKVKGGGAEAYWKRADAGTQFDLDPTLEFTDADDDPNSEKGASAAKKTKDQIEEFEHGLRRYLFTRGIKVNQLKSDVTDFMNPVNSIISIISAGTGIPQRVLMGSEQGKLAAKMDRSNWDDRVSDRRDDYNGPHVVRPFIDRLIAWGALPTPKEYDVRWQELKIMDDDQRAMIAGQWSLLNKNAGVVVVTGDEIRDRILGLPKLEDSAGVLDIAPVAAQRFMRKFKVLSKEKQRFYFERLTLKVAAKGKEAPAWKHVHQAADRFRTSAEKDRARRVRGGTRITEAVVERLGGEGREADPVDLREGHRGDREGA